MQSVLYSGCMQNDLHAPFQLASPYLCTNSYFVDWGDGSHDSKYRDVLGPFQVAHQYAKYRHSYGVTVIYCSDPDPYDAGRRCCDSLYRVIDVSFDPQHPFPAEMFAEN